MAAFLLAALFAPVAPAQTTFTWVGDGSSNLLTTAANWSPSTGLNLNSTSTTLIFPESGSYSPSPYLDTGTYQIGTLSITRTTGGSLWAGHGNGTITSGQIAGVNIASGIVFDTAGAISVSPSGPIMLGSGATISGTAGSTATLSLGVQVGDYNTGANTGTTNGAGIIASAGPITKSGGFDLRLDGDASALGNVTLNGGKLTVSTSGFGFQGNVAAASGTTFTINTNSSYSYGGAVTGLGALTKSGTGTLTLSGTSNTHSGNTTIVGGTLSDGAAGAFSPNSGIFLTGGASSTLNVNFNETIKGLGGVGASAGSAVNLGAGVALTITASNLTYQGSITGASGSLVVGGSPSTQTLTGTSSYGGTTTITGGATVSAAVLANIGVNSSIGTGNAASTATNAASLIFDANSALSFSGSTTQSTDRLFTLGTGGGKILANGTSGAAINFTNANAIAYVSPNVAMTFRLEGTSAATNVFSPAIGDNGTGAVSLSKSGSGLWVVNGANTYTGTTFVFAGTLRVGADNTLPVATSLNISGTAALDLANNQRIDNFASTGNNGTSIAIASGKTFTVAPATTSGTYSGTISGTGALRIDGASNIGAFEWTRVTLEGANTYSGGTVVDGGSLRVRNTTGSGVGTGSVTVNSGGILDGSGSFTGALTMNSGSLLIPDMALTVGATTLNGGMTFGVGLSDAAGTPGTDWSRLSIVGSLTLSASSGNPITIMPITLNGSGEMGAAVNFDPAQSYSWDITTGASGLSGFAANNFVVNPANFVGYTGSFNVSTSGDQLWLNYVGAPVPEPAAYAFGMGLAVAASAGWRRRRRGLTA